MLYNYAIAQQKYIQQNGGNQISQHHHLAQLQWSHQMGQVQMAPHYGNFHQYTAPRPQFAPMPPTYTNFQNPAQYFAPVPNHNSHYSFGQGQWNFQNSMSFNNTSNFQAPMASQNPMNLQGPPGAAPMAPNSYNFCQPDVSLPAQEIVNSVKIQASQDQEVEIEHELDSNQNEINANIPASPSLSTSSVPTPSSISSPPSLDQTQDRNHEFQYDLNQEDFDSVKWYELIKMEDDKIAQDLNSNSSDMAPATASSADLNSTPSPLSSDNVASTSYEQPVIQCEKVATISDAPVDSAPEEQEANEMYSTGDFLEVACEVEVGSSPVPEANGIDCVEEETPIQMQDEDFEFQYDLNQDEFDPVQWNALMQQEDDENVKQLPSISTELVSTSSSDNISSSTFLPSNSNSFGSCEEKPTTLDEDSVPITQGSHVNEDGSDGVILLEDQDDTEIEVFPTPLQVLEFPIKHQFDSFQWDTPIQHEYNVMISEANDVPSTSSAPSNSRYSPYARPCVQVTASCNVPLISGKPKNPTSAVQKRKKTSRPRAQRKPKAPKSQVVVDITPVPKVRRAPPHHPKTSDVQLSEVQSSQDDKVQTVEDVPTSEFQIEQELKRRKERKMRKRRVQELDVFGTLRCDLFDGYDCWALDDCINVNFR